MTDYRLNKTAEQIDEQLDPIVLKAGNDFCPLILNSIEDLEIPTIKGWGDYVFQTSVVFPKKGIYLADIATTFTVSDYNSNEKAMQIYVRNKSIGSRQACYCQMRNLAPSNGYIVPLYASGLVEVQQDNEEWIVAVSVGNMKGTMKLNRFNVVKIA